MKVEKSYTLTVNEEEKQAIRRALLDLSMKNLLKAQEIERYAHDKNVEPIDHKFYMRQREVIKGIIDLIDTAD